MHTHLCYDLDSKNFMQICWTYFYVNQHPLGHLENSALQSSLARISMPWQVTKLRSSTELVD